MRTGKDIGVREALEMMRALTGTFTMRVEEQSGVIIISIKKMIGEPSETRTDDMAPSVEELIGLITDDIEPCIEELEALIADDTEPCIEEIVGLMPVHSSLRR